MATGVEQLPMNSGLTECRASRSVDSQYDEATLWAATMPVVNVSDQSMADIASTSSCNEYDDCDDLPGQTIVRPKVYKVNEDLAWLETARTVLKPRGTPSANKDVRRKQQTAKPTWMSIADRHVNGATKKRKESPTREVFLDPRPTWLKDAKTNLNKPRPVTPEVEQTTTGVWLKTARCSLLPARTQSEESVRAPKAHAPGSVGWLLVARRSLAQTPTSEVFNPLNQTTVEAMMMTADKSQLEGENLLPPPLPASAVYPSSYIGQSTNPDSTFKSNVKHFIDYLYNGSIFKTS